MDATKVFGRKVRREREKLGLSQENFARLASLHRTYIGAVERGEKNLTLRSMKKIANALNIKLRDLIDF